jgi:hypothetical protein
VTPHDWGSVVLGLRPNAKSEDRKEASIRYAYALIGERVDDNRADALCLARYGVRHIALKKRRKTRAA